MHSEAARQKRFQPRACWYIFDLIVVASISSVQQPCACVFTSQVQERTTCMEIACLVARTSISKGPLVTHAGRVLDYRHASEHMPQLSGWSC